MTKQQKRNEKKRSGNSHLKRKLLRTFLRCFDLPLSVNSVVEMAPKAARKRNPLTAEQKAAKNRRDRERRALAKTL